MKSPQPDTRCPH